jgi:RNA 2',3'-cyclic 3'-phosphodiesterase
MRCFISVDITDNVKKEIEKVQEQLPEFLGKKIEYENLHLTLKFLGEVDEKKINEVKKRLSSLKFEKFEAKLDLIGIFSEDFVRIIWLHLTDCEKLQKQIDEKLKNLFKLESRFMSHLTLARVKSINDKKLFLKQLKEIKIPELKFSVNKFSLKKSVLTSSGPVYETLEEYNLI